MRRSVFAFSMLAACASTQGPARCPATAPVATTAASASTAAPAAAQGAPVSELLSRIPRGAEVVARVDVRRFFGTRLGRMASPFMVWSREYARYREACTERPWEELQTLEAVYREGHTAVALLGPVAEESHRCAATVLGAPDVNAFRTRQVGGSVALVLGEDAARPPLMAARLGDGNASEDEAFSRLPPGMASPIAVVLVRGRSYRDAMDYFETLQDELGHREAREGGPARPALPRLELASRQALQTLQGGRIEIGQTASGDLDMRLSMLFATPEDAERYVTTSRDDMRTRIPDYMTRLITQEMRDNPDAPRAAQAFSAEMSSWLTEAAPMEAHGPVVEMSFGGSGSTAITLGVLSAVAIPAFTRYVKRSKTAEATANVTMISTALTQQLNDTPAARRRLVAIPATPAAAPSEAKYPANPAAWATPAWRRVGFSIDVGHYYQYRVDVDGRCYVVAASGDLDGDGTRSTFSRRVCPGADGRYAAGDITIQNELE